MRLDQIKWTPHGKSGSARPVEITRTVWDADGNYYAIMRTTLATPTHAKYSYQIYRFGADPIDADIHEFLAKAFTFDPKGMSPLERKCWLMENRDAIE